MFSNDISFNFTIFSVWNCQWLWISLPTISPNGIFCLKSRNSWIIKFLSFFSYIRETINSRNNLLTRINKSQNFLLFCYQSLNNSRLFISDCQCLNYIGLCFTKYIICSKNRIWSLFDQISNFFSDISGTIRCRQNFCLVKVILIKLNWIQEFFRLLIEVIFRFFRFLLDVRFCFFSFMN